MHGNRPDSAFGLAPRPSHLNSLNPQLAPRPRFPFLLTLPSLIKIVALLTPAIGKNKLTKPDNV